ncbi:MAG TPA: isochorismatase family protein [Opitutaceae bacterium]|nr:isochorismatase family protein [Opitutaceae bacterium]
MSLSPSAESPTRPLDTLLLCVDLQPVFLRVIADAERLQRRCAFAVAAAHGLGLPVLFTEQVPERLGVTQPELRALAPDARVLGKRTFSALADETIRQAIINETNTEHVLLCGIETSVCVYQTAIAALAAGLEVTILSDAVGARRTDDARICLEALARSGVHVLPAETVFYALLHDAAHPFFKAYTRLVKDAGEPSP